MSQSPFISSSALSMDTPVSTLELLEPSGKEIEIKNLSEPISVFLRVNQSESNDLKTITDDISFTDNITYLKFEPGDKNSLYFVIKCSGILRPGERLVVIGKRKSRPSNENFDVSWNLSSCSPTLRKLLSREYLNGSEEFYLGLKLLQEGNVTNSSNEASKITYNVLVKAIGCYYWNENMQAWKKDGCEVKTVALSFIIT